LVYIEHRSTSLCRIAGNCHSCHSFPISVAILGRNRCRSTSFTAQLTCKIDHHYTGAVSGDSLQRAGPHLAVFLAGLNRFAATIAAQKKAAPVGAQQGGQPMLSIQLANRFAMR
jgi:hypothetical protein